MSRRSVLATALLAAVVFTPAVASAQITWDWSFGTNTGTFLTDGTAPGGIAAPATYTLSDFAVLTSGTGATIGSVSGGQYLVSGFSSNAPYSLLWSGSAVTTWFAGGTNGFDWWPFDDTTSGDYILFGWATTNINDPTQAAHYTGNISGPSFPVTVAVATTVTATPEPATMGLMALGLLGIAAIRRKNVKA